MKKTVQTIMTAAMFAAAINTIPSGTPAKTVSASAVDYNPAVEETQDVYGPPPVTTITEPMVQPVYGPSPYWTTTPVSEETVTSPTTTVPATVYGPPIAWDTTTEPVETVPATTGFPTVPVYGPPIAWIGDMNMDGRLDVFDMIELRKAYTEGGVSGGWLDLYRADVNQDGAIGIADLVMLQNYLLGKTDSFNDQPSDPVTTEPEYADTPVTTSTAPIPAPVYGPPNIFE